MITGKFLIIVIAAIGAGVAAVTNAIWGPRARARRRLLAGTKTHVADREIVTLVGKVRMLETLVAPLSDRKCVAYESLGKLFTVEGRSRTLFKELLEINMTAFELVTEDGPVLVDGERLEIALPMLPLIPRKLDLEINFLRQHEQPVEYVSTGSFEEVVIEDGDKIAVQGMALVEFAEKSGAERGYRDAPTRVRIVEHPDHPLTIGKP